MCSSGQRLQFSVCPELTAAGSYSQESLLWKVNKKWHLEIVGILTNSLMECLPVACISHAQHFSVLQCTSYVIIFIMVGESHFSSTQVESTGEITVPSLLCSVLEKAHVPLFRSSPSPFPEPVWSTTRDSFAIPTAGAVVNNCFVPLRYLVLKSLQVKSTEVWAENVSGVPGFQWHGAGSASYVAI